MNRARSVFLLLLASIAFSMPAFADAYAITFTPDLGSTGVIATATATFTSGAVAIDWETDVFTLSASDITQILSDCAPLKATPTACASYSASDQGVYQPKIDVAPLLGIDDNGGSQASFTVLASSTDKSCALLGCSSDGMLSVADLSLAPSVITPEPSTLAMLLPGIMGLALLGCRHKPSIRSGDRLS